MRRRKDVLVLRNEVEARLLEAVLREQGIPHLVKSYADTSYAGIQQPHLGWGHVEAPPAALERIREIYEDLTGHPPGQEDGAPG